MYFDISRDMRLRVLATIAGSNETMAYVLHRSKDKELRELADDLMDNSNKIKQLIKDNTSGIEQKLFLELAEGDYIPPGA
jgi:hypothetical protein